jgi:DNA-binding MarR family transcriptional regulator
MPHAPDPWRLALASLQLATRTIDEIQAGVRAAGFEDVRPLHGFAFMRIADGSATIKELGEYLAISKQAAAQLVDRLVDAGYVRRDPHPHDGRAQLLTLTPRGHSCTVAARAAAEAAARNWRKELTPAELKHFQTALLTLTASEATVRPPL